MGISLTKQQLKALGITTNITIPSNYTKTTHKSHPIVVDEEGMNKTERKFNDQFLLPLKLANEIKGFAFEPIRLILAAKTSLRIDFVVRLNNNCLVYIDVKGRKNLIQDDASVKMKVASDKYESILGRFYIAVYENTWRLYPVTKRSGICNNFIDNSWLSLE